MTRTWQVKALDDAQVRAAEGLARELGVRDATARILAQRGLSDAGRAARFLLPRLSDLRSPEAHGQDMADFTMAVERLRRAVVDGDVIGLFGDYDVDGITSAAVLAGYLGELGARVVTRVARRDAGYGFGVADAEALLDAGARLVVTCDLGTSDLPAIEAVCARDAHVIVVDHHQVPEGDPRAHPALLINPHRSDDRFPFKGLASVGIAFYLVCALRSRLRHTGRVTPDPRLWLDLVAVGTLCDQAPLVEENRILVHHGLTALSERRRPGLRALLESAGVDTLDTAPRTLDEIHVTFKIGPRLNAPGRLGSAEPALALLLSADDSAARAAASVVEDANKERQRVQDLVVIEALAQADARLAADPGCAGLVVAGQGWPPGVVGIVAAKLVDRHGRPAIAIALDGAGTGRGSARTLPGVDLYRALAVCSAHLERWGGHAAAAGLTLRADALPAFTRAFEAAVAGAGAGAGAGLVIDGMLEVSAVDAGLCEDLARLAPFGAGNPEPLLMLSGLRTADTRVVGERHLKLTLDGGQGLEAIAFRLADRDPGPGALIDVACLPKLDEWRGQRRVQLEVRALRVSGEVAGAEAIPVYDDARVNG